MGRPLIDITGKRFGKLIVISQQPYPFGSTSGSIWLCHCDCGNSFITESSALRKGRTQSCGCLNSEKTIQRNKYHSGPNAPHYGKTGEQHPSWTGGKYKRYGITQEQYNALHRKQQGKCAICGVEYCSTGRNLAIDHDHITNNIRGLLCLKCNVGLGAFKDDIHLLEMAISYLQHTS